MSAFNKLRQEYGQAILDLEHLHPDPIAQFRFWLNDALRAGISDANAMVLATAGSNGMASSRVVLLKGADASGFVFFTNYNSKKGRQILENPNGSLLFFWSELERQVRIEGRLDKTSRRESDEYFQIRPEGSRIGAWASPQSQRIPDRAHIDKLYARYARDFKSQDSERPENWGGYRLAPRLFEFWQGREDRLHDRFEYSLEKGVWEIFRLAP